MQPMARCPPSTGNRFGFGAEGTLSHSPLHSSRTQPLVKTPNWQFNPTLGQKAQFGTSRTQPSVKKPNLALQEANFSCLYHCFSLRDPSLSGPPFGPAPREKTQNGWPGRRCWSGPRRARSRPLPGSAPSIRKPHRTMVVRTPSPQEGAKTSLGPPVKRLE